MSYHYWNQFIDAWRNLPPAQLANLNPVAPYDVIHGWTNPNLTQLMNSPKNPIDSSLQYLPEPWWGNDGTHVLNSIVINYNPGAGGREQQYQNSAGLYGYPSYQDFANGEAVSMSNYLPGTNKWHKRKRRARILNTLKRLGINLNGFTQLENHLSIELIPWHTKDIQQVGIYIQSNLQAVFDNSIAFAAKESLRIENTKLRNKVILRCNEDQTMGLLKSFCRQHICNYNVLVKKGFTPSGVGGYFKFDIVQFPGVEFLSIWRTRGFRLGRNDFPPNRDMDWIFTHII